MHALSTSAKPQRVAILHYAGPPVVGGVESTIYHHARLLAQAGYEVRVIVGRGEPFDPRVSVCLVPRLYSQHPEALAAKRQLDQGTVSAAFERLRDDLRGELAAALAGTDACIVHNAMTLHKNLALTAALRELSDQQMTRFIAWCHDFAWCRPQYRPELHPGYPWDLLRQPWPGVTYVVVSEAQREELATLFHCPAEDIQVVPPGVDAAALLRLRPQTTELVSALGLLEAEMVLLLPARITRRKNIELALCITAALHEQGCRAHLVVTGPPGPHNPTNVAYLERLQRLRRELGVEQHVHFLYEQGTEETPFVPDDALLAELYLVADALLFPSVQEGFGIPVLEAGLTRLPVFCSDIAPFRESGGDWIHVFDLSQKPEQIARRIREVLGSDETFCLRRRVRDHYTWQRIFEDRILPLLSPGSSCG
ncbi:MAG: glycosyltransferase family 4 protein [Chloroflexi bacterium]|nr:glycosyltransferase family 4 protein [Chloroflexota bacterium]